MKAGTMSTQLLVQTLKTLRGIQTRVVPEQALQLDHYTIGTIQLNKNGCMYATFTGRLLKPALITVDLIDAGILLILAL
jgi:hypothetical protein